MKIYGYRRPNGGVGFRNLVAILPTVMCSATLATRISFLVEGTVALPHPHGCSELEDDRQRTLRTLVGLGANPNVASVLVVGLGCENVTVAEVVEGLRGTGKRVEYLSIQQEGDTISALGKGVRLAQEMVREASLCKREEVAWEEVILGLKCGGSDATSGLVSNPVLGLAADRVVSLGGTVVLCETTELIGAEHILAEQAADEEVRRRLLQAVAATENIICTLGLDLRGTQPSPGNMAGGLTTIEEKSLGCVCKGGTSPLVEVVDYACRPTRRGLVMMDTPGNDMEAVTGLVAGGAQVIAFTTGCGTPTGSALAPVIKICGNPVTSRRMRANIDVDVSGVISSGESLEEAGERLFEEVVAVLNGKLTKAEVLGHRELAISRIHQSF